MSFIEIIAPIAIILLALALVILIVLLRRRLSVDWTPVQARLESIERGQERGERELREELGRNREEFNMQARFLREEMSGTLTGLNDSVLRQMTELVGLEKQQLESFSRELGRLTEMNEQKIGDLKTAVESKLAQIQSDNAVKLDEMRRTVDEKLETTLERRLGDSFKIVSERLEQVHKGLGEMQSLASGVGDLKRVLTNVKARGTWGEFQLGHLLEQILTPDQYGQNIATKKDSSERVEYAIKLPGRNEEEGEVVWLPIDAKFPKEDYERLVDASERADAAAVEEASRSLEAKIKLEARNISEKYLDPPHTTDFGILFLPTEGLYAEVLRRAGLQEALQQEFRVAIAGPTTLAALLNSLQMGFRTLAIQKRSSEVWSVLGAVKTEFGRFGVIIEKVQKKLQEATNVIDTARTRSRAIEKKLRDVQGLPALEAQTVLSLSESGGDEGEEESQEK
jgi:DNA recombination protein RmuC